MIIMEIDGRIWNLVSNPYPSFLNANDDAHGSNNFLTVNNSKLTHRIWLHMDMTQTEQVLLLMVNFNSNTAKYVAPGQAFLVSFRYLSGDANLIY